MLRAVEVKEVPSRYSSTIWSFKINFSVAMQCERDSGLNFDRLTIADVRSVLPLRDRLYGSINEQWMAFDQANFLNSTAPINDRFEENRTVSRIVPWANRGCSFGHARFRCSW